MRSIRYQSISSLRCQSSRVDASGLRAPGARAALICRLGLTAMVVAGLSSFCGCKNKQEAAPVLPSEVEVVKVDQQDVPIFREWIGTLEADVNASISAQVAGYVVRRAYDEGTAVNKGQLLFQIDPASFEAALAKAKAQLAQAKAMKAKTKLDVDRYRPLAKTDAISQQELDNAIQADQSSDAQIDGAAATVKEAELNLAFTSIVSPIDGLAGLAKAQVGDLVGPGTGALTTVSKLDPIRVRFAVSEQLFYRVQEHRATDGDDPRKSKEISLELLLANGGIYPERGRIKFADNQVDVKTGTIQLVGEFPNSKHLLTPGMFARVKALAGVWTNALLVPQRAVAEMQGRYLVAQVGADDKVSIRPVKVGERVGSQWIIMSDDIKAGDRIVSEGILKVRDGMVVAPKASGAAAVPEAKAGEKKP